MIKTILYTSNPDVKVREFCDVEDFAIINNKYYTCIAKKGSELYNVKEGAHILTTKGNNVYVLEVTEGNEEYDNAKKSNITGIVSIDYPFGEPDGDMFEDIKDTFAFSKVEDVKFSINGQICVRTSNGYVTITDTNELLRYPKGMVIDVPVYVIPKPKKDLCAGDIIVSGDSYAKVVDIKGDKITTISYKGNGQSIYAIKDFLMGEAYVQVVMSPMSGSNMNPMMLALMSKSSDSILPFLMMQQGANMQNNPMMLALMMNKKADKDILQTMLMMQAFQNKPMANPVDEVVEDVAPIANPDIEE